MRTERVPPAVLLLVLASPVLQVSCNNDLYWEGEEYASNKFLEVKQEKPTVLDHLKRFKRQWDPFGFYSPMEAEGAATVTEIPDDTGSNGNDHADLNIGSEVAHNTESAPREKILRVTFLVYEPYITAYSNQDSPEFLTISRSLANAVDLLFESLPGTQRSSVVRIQALVNDDFLCKVTLDIVTTKNEDTDTIRDILSNHIKNNGRLGDISVRDGDFSAQLIDPGGPFFPENKRDVAVSQYTAHLRDSVDLPCTHNLEEPVNIEWRREFPPLAAEVRADQPHLYLISLTEADAGTYVCRVSNNLATVEARAILTVTGVVPRFDGQSFLSLPTLRNAYKQFEIEISFKPAGENGLILYNSENQGRGGDYIGLQLKDGVPEFVMATGTELLIVKGDRPLQLHTWHTIRLSRTTSKITMDVDTTGPFIAESPYKWILLELKQPLYIGGVPDYVQLPAELAGASGFIGCASMLILGREEKNIMMDSLELNRVSECNSCAPNLCLNNGVCQEARNERGYICICASGYAGLNCDRTGEACRPGLCGPDQSTTPSTVTGALTPLPTLENPCAHQCDGTCLGINQICDGQPDCSDGSDEVNCTHCDKPGDFRCYSDECISYLLKCNGIPDCMDASDELNCNQTMMPDRGQFSEKDLREEIRQMHQEFQQLRTELAQLKDSLKTNNCNSSTSKMPSVDDTIASMQWQLNEHDQGLMPKVIGVTGIPEGKAITIKLSVSVADAERVRPIRHKPVEKSGRSISLSISADPVAHRSRSISASLNRPEYKQGSGY